MTESLAIKSDKTQWWIRANQQAEEKAARDLEPFEGEEAKSSWAHVLDDHYIEACFGAEGPRATRALQALAILIFVEKKRPGERSAVSGVSLLRSAINDSVADDQWPHPVEKFDVTHRSIKSATDEMRRGIVRVVFENKAVEPWKYSREELLPLLRLLLDRRLVTDEFRDAAEHLLNRSV